MSQLLHCWHSFVMRGALSHNRVMNYVTLFQMWVLSVYMTVHSGVIANAQICIRTLSSISHCSVS